jgi:Na+-driven multidrug efflux pump
MLAPLIAPLSRIIASWKSILYIGLPTAAARIIVPMAMGAVTRIVAGYGPEAVAAFGVATRVEFFALTIVRALSTVLAPFIGQNWGAGKLDRVKSGIAYSNRLAFGWGGLMFVVIALAARQIAGIFNANPTVISSIVLYLRIVPLGYGIHGSFILAGAALNVLHRPMHAAGLSIAQMFALYLPLALAGSHFFGLVGLFAGLLAALVVGGVIAYIVLRNAVRAETAPRT